MLCKELPKCGKFNFSTLKLSGIFFPNVLEPHLVESVNAEPEAMESCMEYNYSVFIKQK